MAAQVRIVGCCQDCSGNDVVESQSTQVTFRYQQVSVQAIGHIIPFRFRANFQGACLFATYTKEKDRAVGGSEGKGLAVWTEGALSAVLTVWGWDDLR